MRIQGYIRFSYLGKNDTVLSARLSGDPDAHFDALYNPLRMARRFHLFEQLCLPGLRQQSDQDFSVIVAASDVMPQVYKDRLETAVAGLPQVQVHYSDNSSVLHAIRPVLKRFVDASNSPSLHFRLDDDDTLGKDAIALLKAMGERAEPDWILTLPRGYSLFRHGGKAYLVPRYKPFFGVGWTRVNAPRDYRSPFKFGHTRAATRFPSMSDPRPAAYIHAIHSESDTADRNNFSIESFMAANRDVLKPEQQDALKSSVDAAFPALGMQGLSEAVMTIPDEATGWD